MARKVIIDCDPGIDDAVALAMALFDSRLDVLAVTAVEGNVPAPQVNQNVQAIMDHLDPPRIPRIGSTLEQRQGHLVDARHTHGENGLWNIELSVSPHQKHHLAAQCLRVLPYAYPDDLTATSLRPLPYVARAFSAASCLVVLPHPLAILLSC